LQLIHHELFIFAEYRKRFLLRVQNPISDIGQPLTTGTANIGQPLTTGTDNIGQPLTTGTTNVGQPLTTGTTNVGQPLTTGTVPMVGFGFFRKYLSAVRVSDKTRLWQ